MRLTIYIKGEIIALGISHTYYKYLDVMGVKHLYMVFINK